MSCEGTMSYEYNVPFVDFITTFGEDDGADQFFDDLGKLSLEGGLEEDKTGPAENERPILKEISDNSQSTMRPFSQKMVLQDLPASHGQPVQDQTPKCRMRTETVTQNSAVQVSQNIMKVVSTSKHRKHIETMEEVNGELHVIKNEIKHLGVPRTIPNQRTKTVFQSQSFEERQKLPLKRREEKIKKVFEEEQKKREFHANPLPNYLKLSKQKTSAVSTNRCSQNNVKRSSIKPSNVTLCAEKRAKDRKQIDERLKQHNKRIEAALKGRKEENVLREKEEIAALRKKLVHKARPVPVYKNRSTANSNPSQMKNC